MDDPFYGPEFHAITLKFSVSGGGTYITKSGIRDSRAVRSFICKEALEELGHRMTQCDDHVSIYNEEVKVIGLVNLEWKNPHGDGKGIPKRGASRFYVSETQINGYDIWVKGNFPYA
ncbi:hypothetical protein OQA88_1520 [Cercophora sp. LCS_1]